MSAPTAPNPREGSGGAASEGARARRGFLALLRGLLGRQRRRLDALVRRERQVNEPQKARARDERDAELTMWGGARICLSDARGGTAVSRRGRTSGGNIVNETKCTAGHVDQYVVSTSYASSLYRTSPSYGEPFPSAGVSKA